jgi:integrase
VPLDPSLLWPSDLWAAHLGDREDGKAVRDEVAPFPEWWLLMAGQGHPVTPEQRAALQVAHRMITGYTGVALAREVVLFTRAVVRDALHAAPQPVTRIWVRGALSIVSRVADWCVETGQSLTREHVFHPETQHRWLHAGPGADLTDGAVRTYRSRLSIIGIALTTPPEHLVPRVSGLSSPSAPSHTSDEETALWAWSRGLRPLTRRQRVQGTLALCLGTGARRLDLAETRPHDIVRDDAGVHVTFHPTTRSGDQPRTVTCTQAWEDRLWHIAQTTRPDHLIIAPWRTEMTDLASYDKTLRDAALQAPSALNPHRLRHTWLIRHLFAGTPLPILMPAAAISSLKHLADILKTIPEPTADEFRAALRQARG